MGLSQTISDVCRFSVLALLLATPISSADAGDMDVVALKAALASAKRVPNQIYYVDAALEVMSSGSSDQQLSSHSVRWNDELGNLNRLQAGLLTQGVTGAARPPWPGDALGFLRNSH
jgi:hypothetical protein